MAVKYELKRLFQVINIAASHEERMLCIECSDSRVTGKCLQSGLREQTLFEVLTFDHYLVFWESYPQYSLDFSVFHRILFGACSKCKEC